MLEDFLLIIYPQEGTLVKAESVGSVSTDLEDIYGME